MREKSLVKTFWNEKWVKLSTPYPTKNNDYFISNYGKIKSVNKENSDETLLKGSTIRGGYKQLNIRLEGKRRFSVYVHKIVAENFLRKKKKDQQFVIHLDNDNTNNHWQNLKWMSREEMTQWQIDQGIYNPRNKKRSSNTKLTETKVKLIKKRLRSGRTKKSLIAKSMGISSMQLNRIERGENWGYVTIDEKGVKSE